jgi:GR25 family glycosyltransferase involved in LPS biosynthesis
MSNAQCFVIHLARATARAPQVEHLLKVVDMPAEIAPACDGSLLTPAARAKICPGAPLLQPTYPFDLSAGEIGCFESHKAVWEKIVSRGLDYALVLEDDVAIAPETFASALVLARDHIAQHGIIQFQVREISGSYTSLVSNESVHLVQPETVQLRTSAQLVSGVAAARLLSLTEQIDRPVDTFLQMFWQTGIRPVCVVPSGVSDTTAQSGGSTISSRRSWFARMGAEWKRFGYRRKITAFSRRS